MYITISNIMPSGRYDFDIADSIDIASTIPRLVVYGHHTRARGFHDECWLSVATLWYFYSLSYGGIKNEWIFFDLISLPSES